MRWAGLLVLCLAAGAGCRDNASRQQGKEPQALAQSQAPVVYGTDNRTEITDHPDNRLRSRASYSTVALLNASDLPLGSSGYFKAKGRPLGEIYNLCSSERFRDQLAPAFCTGTLIDDDLVLTAGHCLPSTEACASTRFVFDFYYSNPSLTTADVFSCQNIVVRAQGVVNGQKLDYAIARLDRPATPQFTPAPIRAGNRAIPTGQSVAIIGASGGTPLKINSSGAVVEPRAATLDYFVASVDAFHGDSGAAVYEMEGYSVAGILVRGDKDYVTNGSCRVARTCGETGCKGEDVTYVRPAIAAYCQVAASARLCPPAVSVQPSNTYDFVATNTDTAQQNTANKTVTLAVGDQLVAGTCGRPKAFASGDTYLRVFGPDGTQVAANDDACSSRGSQLTFQAKAQGEYELRVGCHGDESCSGTVAWSKTFSGSRAYSASSTNYATRYTENWDLAVQEGQTIDLGTCGVAGASGSGDTYLRLYGPSGYEVASNDNSCGYLSRITYTVPMGGAGTYQVRAGCYYYDNCSGTVAWSVR